MLFRQTRRAPCQRHIPAGVQWGPLHAPAGHDSQVRGGSVLTRRINLIFRDIKAENVFFTSKDHVLLGDFGFAKRLEKMEQHLTTFCGSPPYAAPELFVVNCPNIFFVATFS